MSGEKSMKNKRFKLGEVKTFNKFWFGSCYYHQLYSAVSCIGGNVDEVLLLNLSVPQGNFDSKKVVSEINATAFVDYRTKHCNITERKLLKLIAKGIPVIVGVDCYEMKERMDYYHKTHCRHFVMVYGFDFEKKIFNIVDHNYLNDYMFREKKMPFEELFLANRLYRKFFCVGYTTSCIQVTKNKRSNEDDFFKYVFNKEMLSRAFSFLFEDLEQLKTYFINKNFEFLLLNTDRFISFFTAMKESADILHCINKVPDLICCLEEIITCYIFLRAIFWKISRKKKVELNDEQCRKIIEKIDVLIKSEKALQDYMSVEVGIYG